MRLSDTTRRERLERVELLLQRHPDGLREAEIAESLNFERRTVNNYLRELEVQGHVYREDQVWFALSHRDMVLRRLKLQPEEAMTLYLAVRLFVKQHDERNEAAEHVLMRLAEILTSDVGLSEDILAAARELAQRPAMPGYEDVFRILMHSYIYRHKVEIVYAPYQGKPFTTVLSPYLIEPSAIGFATYAIGHSSVVNALRTFKLERISQAHLLRQEYQIPSDFPGLELLRSAWSIYYGEQLTRVVLRFHPDVARRVRETQWHPSQELYPDPERPEFQRMAIQIADFTDLIPWIRGWGSACEVLEPPPLRRIIIKEVQRIATIYQLAPSSSSSPLAALWAKADAKTGEYHLLIYHLIDVAAVALALWQQALSANVRAQVARWLNLSEEYAGRLIAFWAGLHDIGKACPGFQGKSSLTATALSQTGLADAIRQADDIPHGIVSAYVLPSLLSDENLRFVRKLARAIGGHHGVWPLPKDLQSASQFTDANLGGQAWDQARLELVNTLRQIVATPDKVQVSLPQNEENALLTWLSGLISVADWIGSMTESFPYEERLDDLQAYAERSFQQAELALDQLGWLDWHSTCDLLPFDSLFPALSPNEIQRAVIDIADACELPALIILEAPTGIGKTEAALYLADHWLQRGQERGLYVAMPSQATSNQMYERVARFLKQRFRDDVVSLHLLHAQARWILPTLRPRLSDIAQDEQHTVAASEWFVTHRKRGLLAPFAVGTVDQALLSVLLTKHFFVRMFGLAHKVVIFDEIHAYDTYMSELFTRLLRWLKQLGTSVILLSATLPNGTRRELIESYAGQIVEPEVLTNASYPRLTLCSAETIHTIELPPPVSRTIALEWIDQASDEIARRLARELDEGGCAVVICNTVRRAQEVFAAIEQAEFLHPEEPLLLHSRFPYAWRQEIEQDVLRLFGKQGERPLRAILVATQIVEQSLDLDFDLMITDPAPIDLILQRAGRLHRHPYRQRPVTLAAPRLLLTTPAQQDGIPDFRPDEYVYDYYTLLASTLILQDLGEIVLPDHTSQLIEAVYGERDWFDALPKRLATVLNDALAEMQKKHDREIHQALQRVVRMPGNEDLLNQPNEMLEEEAPEIHEAFQALTRLAEPGISTVCLHRTLRGIALDPEGNWPIDPEAPLMPEIEQQLLQYSLTIQHRAVRPALAKQSTPANWSKSPLLRHHRLAVFSDGLCDVPGARYMLRLTRRLGLEVIEK
jgi:CRISPR-associated endonuclease/helicase Cas3